MQGFERLPKLPQFPANLQQFEIDDFDDFGQSWYRGLESYDLIHCSLGNAFSKRDWKLFLDESYKSGNSSVTPYDHHC